MILPESLVSELDESKDSRDDLITVKVQTSRERQPREFKISKVTGKKKRTVSI